VPPLQENPSPGSRSKARFDGPSTYHSLEFAWLAYKVQIGRRTPLESGCSGRLVVRPLMAPPLATREGDGRVEPFRRSNSAPSGQRIRPEMLTMNEARRTAITAAGAAGEAELRHDRRFPCPTPRTIGVGTTAGREIRVLIPL
jgi:hypothetical protein